MACPLCLMVILTIRKSNFGVRRAMERRTNFTRELTDNVYSISKSAPLFSERQLSNSLKRFLKTPQIIVLSGNWLEQAQASARTTAKPMTVFREKTLGIKSGPARRRLAKPSSFSAWSQAQNRD